MGPDLWELFEDGQDSDEIAAIIRLGDHAALPEGVRLVTQFGQIVTVRLKRGAIPGVSGSSEVDGMVAGASFLGPDLEEESAEAGVLSPDELLSTDERRPPHEAATGRGVVIGVVDWGFDFAHPDFLKADGTSRILALWDQRGGRQPNSPQPFGYGIVHDREAINRALKAPDPYAALNYHPADADTGIGCHGTHVASIAGGSGGHGRPVGIAPEADFVFVHNAPFNYVEPGRLGDSVTVYEGIDFISRTAGDRPWAVNLSMGRHCEGHDGTTLVEQGLDAAIRAAPGRAVCLSAGNYFDKRIHASGQLRPTQERTFVWEINHAAPTYNELEIWYSWQDKFEAEVRSPDGSVSGRARIGERAKFIVGGKEIGNIYHSREPNSLDNKIHIFFYKKDPPGAWGEAPPGAWEVTVRGLDVIDGRYHAWIERDVSCPKCQSHFHASDADPHSTTGTICNGRRTIAVGAYNRHDPETTVARFSSLGPTRDGRLKPDLCAPGVSVLAARSRPRTVSGEIPLLTRMSGTSMAAPHVTGTVALMFQAAPRPLRIEETHNLLLEAADRVSIHEQFPDRIGIGYLDVSAAVEAARNVGSATTFKQLNVEAPAAAPKPSAGKEIVEMESGEVASATLHPDTERESLAEAGVSEEETDNTYFRIASDITSAFEGGSVGSLNLMDRGIISYGRHQTTLASGGLHELLAAYLRILGSVAAIRIGTYLDRVQRRDPTLSHDEDFLRLLRDAGADPAMALAQDEQALARWTTVVPIARQMRIRSALGYALLYDTKVQGGLNEILSRAEQSVGGYIGDTSRGQAIGEREFLEAFVSERIATLLQNSEANRKKAKELTVQVQALEDEASQRLGHTGVLVSQADEIRHEARRYAVNASALEASARLTRGPSFSALVRSGDLDLRGDASGRVSLVGKPGVVIRGLTPGATVGGGAPAEMEAESGPGKVESSECGCDQAGASENAEGAEATGLLAQAEQAAESDATELVELADKIVADQPAASLMDEILKRQIGAPFDEASPISTANVFDALVYPNWSAARLTINREPLRKELERVFSVVARPLDVLQEVREGDLLLRRAEDDFGHVAIIASRELMNLDALQRAGLQPESSRQGLYVQVIETGARPHARSDSFARRVADESRRVPLDTLILRIDSSSASLHGSEGEQDATPESEQGGYIRFIQGALNQSELKPALGMKIPVTGVLDEVTRQAIRKFQFFKGLPEDGIPGPAVLAALVSAGGLFSTIVAPLVKTSVCPGEVQETISGFPRYSNAVENLPPAERAKVSALAAAIRRSFDRDCDPIGATNIIGHADRDPVRESRDPGFEMRVSVQRAQAMERALRAGVADSQMAARIEWRVEGKGSSNLLIPQPRNEADRLRNRRVEVKLVPSPTPVDRASGLDLVKKPDVYTSRNFAASEDDTPKPLKIPYQESLEKSVYQIARWINATDDRAAASAAQLLLSDPKTEFTVSGKPATRDGYEEFAKKEKMVVLLGGAVQSLCALLRTNPDNLKRAVDGQKKFGTLLDLANQALFFGIFGNDKKPLDPKGAATDSRKARQKRNPLGGNDAVLTNPQVAQLYLVLLNAFAKPGLERSVLDDMAKDGLDARELDLIIAKDVRRRTVTDYFTQGVVEYRNAKGSDIAGEFFRLEECLLSQLTFGNPTAVKNDLAIGVGLPENRMGLMFRPDGILYYTADSCLPLQSFAGGGLRDPGYRAAANDPGLINIDWISDPVLRDFFKLLHDRFKTPALIIAKGAEAYWANHEEVNARVQKGLPQEVRDHMIDAVKILLGFLLWRAAAMAFMRSSYPPLQAVGAAMEVLAEAAGYVLQIEFLGSIEAQLVTIALELSRITPKLGPAYDTASEYHLEQAVRLIRPIIADVIAQLILVATLKGLSRDKARDAARDELDAITKKGKRVRLRCRSPCEIVQEAAEFSKSLGKDYYENTRKARGAKPGAVLTDPKYPTVEIHPDGNIFGEHTKLVKFIKDAGLSKSGSLGEEVESHHLMEDNQMEGFGVPRDRGRCVALVKQDHGDYSGAMRGLLNRKTLVDIDDLYDLHREMYQDNGNPEYVPQLRAFLREWRDVIRERYEKGQVPGGRFSNLRERRERVFKFLDSL